VAEPATLAPARALLDNLPKLHYWGGAEQVGGLNAVIGDRMITELGHYDSPRVIETGAGATTLLFCCLDPGALVSIAPNAELRDRIFAEASKREIALTRLFFVCDRSETALPRIAADRNRFDVGLIDGSHNWPSVFVDFCYINMMMPAGGTLFVDDTHLYSVSQLFQLLQRQEQFEFVALDHKMATFRKLVDRPFLPEWNGEPYIAENSPVSVG
jgi:Methyltransferase domain